jgi:cytochrome d ubiquinol oxidase subunit I
VTDAQGIWGAFIFTLLLYTALGVTAVLVLRRMSRRWREDGEGAAEEVPGPYGPIGPEVKA